MNFNRDFLEFLFFKIRIDPKLDIYFLGVKTNFLDVADFLFFPQEVKMSNFEYSKFAFVINLSLPAIFKIRYLKKFVLQPLGHIYEVSLKNLGED